jgi:hypothetical protein
MKSQKFLSNYKSQKSIREDLQKEDFFETVMSRMEEELTVEEHEFLLTFVLQNRAKERNGQPEYPSSCPKPPASNRQEESPLLQIREDVFREHRRNNKRVTTLAEVQSAVRPVPPSPKQLLRAPREHFHTVFTQQENKPPSSPLKVTSRDHSKRKLFKIYPVKRAKLPDSKALLKERKVV